MKAAILLALVSLSAAQAAEPNTLTLTCEGTVDPWGVPPSPISVSIVLDFAAGTMTNFFTDVPWVTVRMGAVDDVHITFGGRGSRDDLLPNISGSIDRVTGGLEAWALYVGGQKKYSLKCRPAQRMF
jgi:hypothetical protein